MAKKGADEFRSALADAQAAHEREAQALEKSAHDAKTELATTKARLEAVTAELSDTRRDVSSLRDALAQKDAHVKAAREAEAALARRLSQVQTSAADLERSSSQALTRARSDADAAERRVCAQKREGERAAEQERARAKELVEQLTAKFERRLSDSRAELAHCESRLQVRELLCPERDTSTATGLVVEPIVQCVLSVSLAAQCLHKQRQRGTACVQEESASHERTRSELAGSREQSESTDAANAVLRTELQAASSSATAERAARDSALSEAEARRQATEAALRADIDKLNLRCAALDAENQALRAELAGCAADMQGMHERQKSALISVGASRRQERAVVVIQRAWRRWQRREAAEAAARDARGWHAERAMLSQQQRRAAAEAGRSLIVATMQQVDATMQTLLLEMLLSGPVKRKLKAARAAAGVYGSLTPPASSGVLTPPSAMTPRAGSTPNTGAPSSAASSLERYGPRRHVG